MAEGSAYEKIQARLRKMELGRGKLWKPKKGQNRIRILPSWRGPEEEFYKEAPTHWNVGPESNRSVICPKVVGQKCPICELADKYAKSDNSKKQAIAEKLQPRTRVIFNILDLDAKDGQVHQWSCSEAQLQELLSYYIDPDYGDFTNWKSGFDVIIIRKGEGLNTRYKVRLSRNPSKVKDWKKLRKALPNLDQKYKPYDTQKILSIMSGEDNKEDSE